MSLDDDLFEDNEVNLDSNSSDFNVDTDATNFDDFSTFSPEYRTLIENLKKTFENIDSFSFSIYPITYLHILDHLQSLYPYLNRVDSAFPIALQKAFLDQEHSYDQHLAHEEAKRMIVAAGFVNQCCGHLIAQLKDDPTSSHIDSFTHYCYERLVSEYTLSTDYLNHCIDLYKDFCDKNDFFIHSSVCEEQVFSHLSVIERNVYGTFVNAYSIENVGDFPDASDRVAEMANSNTQYLNHFILRINSLIDNIKNDNAFELQEYFN